MKRTRIVPRAVFSLAAASVVPVWFASACAERRFNGVANIMVPQPHEDAGIAPGVAATGFVPPPPQGVAAHAFDNRVLGVAAPAFTGPPHVPASDASLSGPPKDAGKK